VDHMRCEIGVFIKGGANRLPSLNLYNYFF
jgi:hypothetical protein